MLKQGLEIKQTQKLSPLQIQTIKLIELPIQELEQKVKSELEDNPVLDDSPATPSVQHFFGEGEFHSEFDGAVGLPQPVQTRS